MNRAIKVKRLEHAHELSAPIRMSAGASGADVAAAIYDDLIIEPGRRAIIPTGFCFEIPEGFEVQVRSRSGLSIKYGIVVLNSPGTIDSDYRGEVKIILANLGEKPFTVSRGDRIAQLVPMKLPIDLVFVENNILSRTDRDEGGFGSSGIQ